MPKLEENQISAVSRIFSTTVIKELARHGKSVLLKRLLKESFLLNTIPESETIRQVFEVGFSLLKNKQNRNEYIYKSALIEKLLLGVHNLQTASMLTEFRVENCKADFVILNGTATAYEIKSERDSLSRLESQIKAYSKVFAKVNIIVGENHLDSVLLMVPKEIGVLKLSNRYQISTIREGLEEPGRTCPATIFESLQLKESKAILEDLEIKTPEVPNTQMYANLKSIFLTLNPIDAHYGMVRILKKTRNLISRKGLINNLPLSLQAVALTTPLRKRDHQRLISAMETPIHDAIKWT